MARGNTQVNKKSSQCEIEIGGNARIVHDPETIHEYMEFYGLEHNETTGRFFKAVRKSGEGYFSDHDRHFKYVIGEVAIADGLNTDVYEDCGRGIHMAYKAWCLDYGRDWNDLAILEVEAKIQNIIVPVDGPGKVRTNKVKVIREVPLEECGLYGKLLAKKRNAN